MHSLLQLNECSHYLDIVYIEDTDYDSVLKVGCSSSRH
jgi:hypothetical protein